MNIVMLGHSEAGKTTYVSSMYATMDAGVRDFTLRTRRDDDHQALLRAARDVHNRRWPPATDQRAAYDFVLRHRDQDVFDFKWSDYRGAAVGERSDSVQARQLHADLKAAGGIVVFADSVKLLRDPDAAFDSQLLVQHVLRGLGDRDRTATPLAIVFTKSDLVDAANPDVDWQLQKPFTALIDAVRGTAHVEGTVVHVACGPNPRNVQLPVLWTLRVVIRARIAALQAAEESLRRQASRHEQSDAPLTRFERWARRQSTTAAETWLHANFPELPARDELLRKLPSEFRDAERARSEANAELRRYRALEQPAEALGDLLTDLYKF